MVERSFLLLKGLLLVSMGFAGLGKSRKHTLGRRTRLFNSVSVVGSCHQYSVHRHKLSHLKVCAQITTDHSCSVLLAIVLSCVTYHKNKTYHN